MASLVALPVQAVPGRGRSPLALWHLLSLDAPTVAAVWVTFVARAFGMRVSASVPLALALAVWMLYAADRMADGVKDALHGRDLQDRHRFHFKHRHAFGIVWVCMVPVLSVLVFRLPHGLRDAWLLLSLPLLLYVVAVHGFRRWRVPKEMCVGLFFGTATALPVVVARSAAWTSFLPGVLLLSALASLNGIAISRWEGAPHCTTGACTAWLARRLNPAGIFLAVLSAALLLQLQSRPVAMTALLSTALLLWLDRLRPQIDGVHLRALADAALLTPLAVWPFLSLLTAR